MKRKKSIEDIFKVDVHTRVEYLASLPKYESDELLNKMSDEQLQQLIDEYDDEIFKLDEECLRLEDEMKKMEE